MWADGRCITTSGSDGFSLVVARPCVVEVRLICELWRLGLPQLPRDSFCCILGAFLVDKGLLVVLRNTVILANFVFHLYFYMLTRISVNSKEFTS